MNQQKEQIKAELAQQIQTTKDPIIKRTLEKRLNELDKTVTK